MWNHRKPTKADSFNVLKPLGVRTVVDVGVRVKTESLMLAFPDCEHVLIETDRKWIGTYEETYRHIRHREFWMHAGQVNRVDSISMQGPFLINVDVDGPELDVLKGCTGIFKDTVAIVVEAVTYEMFSIMRFLTEQDFALFDIVDLCYCGSQLHQCDLVFVRSDLQALVLKPFDITHFYEH